MQSLPTPMSPIVLPRGVFERAQGELIAGNPTDAAVRQLPPLVRESWQRSIRLRIATERRAEVELEGDALADYQREHPLGGSLELIRSLLVGDHTDDLGVIIAVGDAAGRLFWIGGDERLRAGAAEMGFFEGTNWSEEQIGTSAPGTALTLGRTVQVRGPEHYNRLVQPWSCSATPVRDPETGSLLGVIDVTGGEAAVTLQAQLLLEATARAVESDLLVARMRERAKRAPARPREVTAPAYESALLQVLGRDHALLRAAGVDDKRAAELSARHGEILLVLSQHPHGITAERLAAEVYGTPETVATLRSEMVRLRKVLRRAAPGLAPSSRPYRLPVALSSDLRQVHELLERGARRRALTAVVGDVLPGSIAPGVERARESLALSFHESMLGEASLETLLEFVDSPLGSNDVEAMRQCLVMLPARSPRRAGLVARIERMLA